jgi:hypothetical protein
LASAAEGLVFLDRGLALCLRIHEVRSPPCAIARHNRATALAKLTRWREALDEDEQAVSIESAGDHWALAYALAGVGEDQLGLGDAAAAAIALEQALAAFARRHVAVLEWARPQLLLARALYQTGKKTRALSLAAASEAVYAGAEKQLGGDFGARKKEVSDWLAAHR